MVPRAIRIHVQPISSSLQGAATLNNLDASDAFISKVCRAERVGPLVPVAADGSVPAPPQHAQHQEDQGGQQGLHQAAPGPRCDAAHGRNEEGLTEVRGGQVIPACNHEEGRRDWRAGDPRPLSTQETPRQSGG